MAEPRPGGSPLVCRCREVTEAEVLRAIRDGARSLRGVKVRTRAMTGLCQGQTCGPIIESILKRELGADLRLDGRAARGPARLLAVQVLAGTAPYPPAPLPPEGGNDGKAGR